MEEYITKYSDLFIHYYSNKSRSTCKLFISTPSPALEEIKGKVFGIIEINTPNRDNANIIAQLIAEIEEVYYGDAEGLAVDEAFEQALAKANKKFNTLLENHPTYLVGTLDQHSIKEKINLAVGVLQGTKLYLSHLNSIGSYLIHKTKQDYSIIDITGGEKDADPENINIFSNIISGELRPGDYFFLSNKDFLEFITQERIRKIVSSLPPHKATEYFKNALLQHEGYNFGAIIIQQQVQESADRPIPESLSSIGVLNATESNTEQLLSPSFFPTMGGIVKAVVHKFRSTTQKDTLHKGVEVEEEHQVTAVPVANDTSVAHDSQPSDPEPFQMRAKKQRNLKKTFNTVITSTQKLFRTLFPPERFGRIGKFLYLRWNQLINKAKSIPEISKWLLIAAVSLCALLIFSVVFLQHQNKSEVLSQDFTDTFTKVEEFTADAQAKILIGDSEGAKAALIEAQNVLETLPVDSSKQRQAAQELSDSIKALIIKLRNITTIDYPNILGTVHSDTGTPDVQFIALHSGSVYAFDAAQNTITKVADGTATISLSQNDLISNIRRVKVIDGTIFINHEGGFFTYNPQSRILTPFSVEGADANQIIDFTTYNNRLYTLDATANQIYRYSSNGSGYGGGIAWLSQPFDITRLIGIGIDTSIWVMDDTGTISKLTKGTKTTFDQPSIEPALEHPTRFYTDEHSDFLYALEPVNRRIVVISKEGKLVTQYFSESFDNLKDFSVSESENTIYLVNGNTILSFPLSHL